MQKINLAIRRSKGFTLVELMFVLAFIGVLAALGIPQIRGMMIEGRIEPTGKDIINVTNTMRAAANSSGSPTPYLNLGAAAAATAAFANAANGKALSLTVAGAGAAATVQHQIGASNSQVGVLVAANPNAGDSFDVTFPTVSKSACPGLATNINRAASAIQVNGVVVKPFNGAYNGAAAENACVAGDNNTFIFTFGT